MKNKLPKGWKEVEFGGIFTFQKKSTIKAGEGLSKGKYKFFTSSDKQSKYIDKYAQGGEFLIFATGGHAGVHYCNEKFATSTDCFVAKVDDKVMAKYVYYYLFSRIQILEEGFKGAGLKHISKGYIEDIKIIYPENKETQKKIVSILEKAEKSKEWRKEADDLTKDFLKSVFTEMFGDEKKFESVELGEVARLINGRAYSQEELLDKGKTLVLRVGNFFSNNSWYYSNLELEEDKYCNKGDLLYAWSASFGPKIWDGPRAIYHYHIWKLELNNKINKIFMFHLLEKKTNEIKSTGHGITMIHVTKAGIEKFCSIKWTFYDMHIRKYAIPYLRSIP